MLHEQILITCNVYLIYCAPLKVFFCKWKEDCSCHYFWFTFIPLSLVSVYKTQTESYKRGAKNQHVEKTRGMADTKKKGEETTKVKQRNR